MKRFELAPSFAPRAQDEAPEQCFPVEPVGSDSNSIPSIAIVFERSLAPGLLFYAA